MYLTFALYSSSLAQSTPNSFRGTLVLKNIIQQKKNTAIFTSKIFSMAMPIYNLLFLNGLVSCYNKRCSISYTCCSLMNNNDPVYVLNFFLPYKCATQEKLYAYLLPGFPKPFFLYPY